MKVFLFPYFFRFLQHRTIFDWRRWTYTQRSIINNKIIAIAIGEVIIFLIFFPY